MASLVFPSVCSPVATQTKRRRQFTVTRAKIEKMLEALALSPNSSFEREVVGNPHAVKLSPENLRGMQQYHDEVRTAVLDI